MAAGRSSTGISPRPMLMGAPRNALRAFNAGVSLSCLYVVARKLPRSHCGVVLIAPLIPTGKSIVAHQPSGSAQTECVRMPYDAPPLSCGHICQGTASGPPWVGETGKGLSCFSLRGPVRHFVVTIAWMSLISRRRFMASSRHT